MEAPYTKQQLRQILSMAQQDFLTGKEKDEMTDELCRHQAFEKVKRKTVGEYLGTSIKNRHATYPQLKAAIDWVKIRIGEDNYQALLQLTIQELQAA